MVHRVFDESVNFEENFMNPDCDICSDGSPCTCGESQEVNEMNPAKHVQKNDETGMYCVYNKSGEKVKEFEDKADAVKYATDNHDKLMEKLDADDTPQIKKIVKKLKGASKAHADQAKSLEKELSDDIRNLPKDKQRALQHADKTAKPKSKVSLAPTPGIKTEETNLDEAFEQFFTEGYEGEVKKVLDKKGIDAYFKNGKLMVSKRDKGMVIQILKRQDFDMPKIQVEEIQMESNRFGLSVSLVDAVADVLAGKRPVEEKKKMDPVGQEDGDIDNDGDKDSSDEYLMKKRKAIGKAMKKDDGGKEPVDTKPKMDEEKIDEKLTPAQRDMRDAGRDNMGGVGVREGEMTDAQMKRREEIVKELKKKSADFESRYGDKADAVMYATATKMAMKGK
jgi:hypothetical protein